MLQQKVPVPGLHNAHFNLIPGRDKVIIEPSVELKSLDNQRTVEITWEEMLNLPVLADKLGNMRVSAFRPVVEALGVMYANKHIYEALIE
jgi:hypothetical protein